MMVERHLIEFVPCTIVMTRENLSQATILIIYSLPGIMLCRNSKNYQPFTRMHCLLLWGRRNEVFTSETEYR
jgi:hypothetical protein